jgi:DNA replication protein DnaC
MTQPLKPQSIARPNQDVSQQGTHSQTPTPQLVGREQVQQNTAVNPCPICLGAGYLRADVPYGHPSFGKPIACECKEAERKTKRRRQLQEMSDLGAFYDKSFRNFNTRVPGIQEAFRCAYEFAQDPNGWLLLIGPNGCGKTHLAAAIANKSLEDGALVLFATVPDLLDHLRAAFAPTSNEVYDQLFSRMREAEVLVLDDLGAQQSSPWANEKLFQLLNYRYNSRFPTVITANSRGLQGIDERIRSRLTDASLVTTVILDRAMDYRPNSPRRV